MKLKADVSDLQRITSQAGLSVLKNSMNPMFQGIALKAGKTTLQALGSRIEASSAGSLQADVADPGAIVIPHARFVATVAKLSPGTVILETKGMTLELKVKGAKYRFQGHPIDEYPEPRSPEKGQWFDIPRDELVKSLKAVMPSVGSGNARVELQSIRLRFSDQGMRALTTNGIRLSCCTEPLVCLDDVDSEILLPGAGAQILIGNLNTLSDEEVQVSFGERIWAQVPGASCSVQLARVDGSLVDESPYLVSPEFYYEVDRVAFLQALKRLSVFGANVVCECSSSQIKLSVEDEQAAGSERIKAKGSGDFSAKVALAPFEDGLSMMASDKVLFGGSGLNIVTVRDEHQIHGAMPIARK